MRKGGGGSICTTNEHCSSFPAASLTTQETAVRPRGNIEPEGGRQTISPTAAQSSVADACQVAIPPCALDACTTTFDGQSSLGGMVSSTSTINSQVEVSLPSPAVQSTRCVPRLKTLP